MTAQTTIPPTAIIDTVNGPAKATQLPFPLETLMDDFAQLFMTLDTCHKRLEVAKRHNQNTHTPAKQKQLQRIQYKIGTCKHLIKGCAEELDQLSL